MHSASIALKKKALMIIEVDMERERERVYDRIKWPYLYALLRPYAFHEQFVRWFGGMCI